MMHLPTPSHAVLNIEPDRCARHLLDFVVAQDDLIGVLTGVAVA
jgi:hypothetical protein